MGSEIKSEKLTESQPKVEDKMIVIDEGEDLSGDQLVADFE